MKDFFNDALKHGALLGVLMGLSRVYETWELFLSDTSGVSMLFMVEWLVSVVLFVTLLYRFTKSYSTRFDAAAGFSFSQGLSYVFVVSILAGIIVGAMYHIYIGVVGYSAYVEGYLQLVDEYVAMLNKAGVGDMYATMLNDIRTLVRDSEPQSIFGTIVSSMNNYIIAGGFVGIIIAVILSRKPEGEF